MKTKPVVVTGDASTGKLVVLGVELLAASTGGAALTSQQLHLFGMAHEIVNDTVTVADKYRQLVEYARKEQVLGGELRTPLAAAGFSASRVSEILRVAALPDKVYNEYAGKLIGMKRALSLARGEDGETETPPHVTDRVKLQHAIERVLSLCEKLYKPQSVSLYGWRLQVKRVTKKGGVK